MAQEEERAAVRGGPKDGLAHGPEREADSVPTPGGRPEDRPAPPSVPVRPGRGAPLHDAPAHKRRRGRGARFLRLLGGALDPRAWAHAVRIVNYYNYAHVQPRRRIAMGPGCAISPNAVFSNPENIRLGARVSLGARCHLWAGPGRGRITIGDDVLFGPEVMVTAASYRYDDGQPVTAQAMDEADVTIGRDAWLGTRAVVLPGATVGEGAIIGAGALVRGSIPPFAIAVGAPARVIGRRRLAKAPAPEGGATEERPEV